eukprot:3256064-Prymnesium_polylepis.1
MFGIPRQGRTARLGARGGCAREEHNINNNEGKRQPRSWAVRGAPRWDAVRGYSVRRLNQRAHSRKQRVRRRCGGGCGGGGE